MLIAIAIVVLAAAVLIGAKIVSQALDNLTNSVGALETTGTAVVAEIAGLKDGSTDAALPALTARIDAVTTELGGTPPAPPA